MLGFIIVINIIINRLLESADKRGGLPCDDARSNTGKNNVQWITTDLNKNSDMKISFTGEFNQITRLTKLRIDWTVAPKFLSIQYTMDKIIYFDLINELYYCKIYFSKMDETNDP